MANKEVLLANTFTVLICESETFRNLNISMDMKSNNQYSATKEDVKISIF